MKDLKQKPRSVEELQGYLKSLYGAANEGRSFEYLFSYLFRNASYLARSIQKGSPCIPNFMKTFSWLFALANKFEIDLSDAYLKKYPDVCPYCVSKPCACAKTNKNPVPHLKWKVDEELKSKYGIAKIANQSLSVDALVSAVNDLYPANAYIWKAAGPAFHFFRLLEELGEVHEAYTAFCQGRKEKAEIANELADCLAWIVSAWGIYCQGESLGDNFVQYYYDSCPVCKAVPCTCKDYSDRGEMLAKLEQLREYKEKIIELLRVAPNHEEQIKDMIKVLESAERSGSTQAAITAVKQSESTLENISNQLGHLDNSAKSIKSIISVAMATVKSFQWLS